MILARVRNRTNHSRVVSCRDPPVLTTGYNRVAVVTCQVVTRSSNYPAAGWRESWRRRGAAAGSTEFNGFFSPEEKWGARSRSLENGAGSKIGAIARMLPEYFTDETRWWLSRRYPWPRYKKPGGRRRLQFLEFVAVLLYIVAFISRVIALGEPSVISGDRGG